MALLDLEEYLFYGLNMTIKCCVPTPNVYVKNCSLHEI